MQLPPDFLPTLVNALAPLVLALLGWLLTTLAMYVRQRTAAMKNQYLAGVLERLDDAVETAVREASQTLVDDMRKAAADGTISKDEAREARDHALGKLKAYMGPKGVAELGRVMALDVGGIDSYLAGKVEAKVNALKGERGALPAEPVVPGGGS